MKHVCSNCSKTNNDVKYMICAGEDLSVCSDCIEKFDYSIQNVLNSNGLFIPEEIVIDKSVTCCFCNESNNLFLVKWGDLHICNNCLRTVYETGIDYGYDTAFLKKCLKNLNKIEDLYLKNFPLSTEQKFENLFKRRIFILEKTNNQLQSQKSWLRNIFLLILVLSVVNIKEMMDFPSLICIADILLLISGLFVGYSAAEYLKLKFLERDEADKLRILKDCTLKNILYLTLLLAVFAIMNYACLNIPVFMEAEKDNYLSKLNILPMAVLMYSLLLHLRIYFCPSYFYSLINRNIKIDFLQLFAVILITVSLIVLGYTKLIGIIS